MPGNLFENLHAVHLGFLNFMDCILSENIPEAKKFSWEEIILEPIFAEFGFAILPYKHDLNSITMKKYANFNKKPYYFLKKYTIRFARLSSEKFDCFEAFHRKNKFG